MQPEPARTTKSAYFGLLFLAAATLLCEVSLTRILSVSLWYHFAFMVISTALFGLGFAGVVLGLRKKAGLVSARLVAVGAIGTPVAFICGYWLFNLVPFEPFSLGVDSLQWVYLPLSYLAVTIPFFFSGLTIAAMLTRHARSVHRLYLFDLVGAGGGSLLVVFLLPLFGGSGTIFVSAALAAVAAVLLTAEQGKAWVYSAAGVLILLIVLVPFADKLIPVRVSSNKMFGKVLADPHKNLFTTWNTISRIDVIKYNDRHGVEQRSILIDAGTALTRMAHPQTPLDELVPGLSDEAFFYGLYQNAHSLVVGSGGGREVLMALRNGASKVSAVEINPAINHLVSEKMADFTGHLYQDPRVMAVTDEARSYIRRSSERYQLIHCPHTISNAAMSSGSLSLAENHLLTLEAFDDYLDHLSDDGLLLITRPEAHLPRLFVTIRQTFELHARKDLAASVLAWRRPSPDLSFYAGFAVRLKPFSLTEIQAFVQVLKANRLEALYLPGSTSMAPYYDLLTAADPTAVAVPFAAILTPATDDKPFFNRRVPFSEISWSDLVAVFSRGQGGRMALEDRPVAESALLVLLLETLLVSLLFIVFPLIVFKRRALAGSGRLRTLAAFFSLGLAYIVVEVGFIQRFTLYLGQPVLVFSTVLGTLLVMSGLGSGYARKFKGTQAPWRACWLAAAVALVTAFAAPLIVGWTLAWPGWLRVMMAILILAPAGFVMGMPFPLLVRRLEGSYPERIPWAWGVNGFASVVGSIGAVILGMTLGFTAVLIFGVGCYLLAALSTGKEFMSLPSS
ncbi:MAG: hypothetical protein JRJ87_21715 [Deltaproteobacteria bacterium]|nr:hypothetical protein [Deltaproteobacteria bacterium]